ncbi:MAG: hypothetical protein KJ667_06595, partial [Alphaproteobacteria bacterium]|nr:hypothetical protein [Alphaproteobacteria bacterium]
MSLKAEFEKYVGLIVKDPQRMTCDTDLEGEKIYELARKHGLHVNFVKDGEPSEPFMADVEAVHVYLSRDGVPADKRGQWRVA